MRPRRIAVTCVVEIEQSGESFHAHAIPLGIDIRPGDRVLVHGAPTSVAFGSRVSVPCHATVIRASWIAQAWTRAMALFELTELYEVGFAPREKS
jgi:hypothetical protein